MQLRDWFRLVRFSHTLFALPFAAVGYSLGVIETKVFSWQTLGLVLLCMVTNRNAAMAFNRLVDARYDAQNPRTAAREIPRGVISRKGAIGFIIINTLLFMASAYALAPLAGWLSLVALVVVLGYSLTKRVTWLCHYILGAGLALAPIGAFLGVSGGFSIPILALSLGVMLWVAGFDIIYALQDADFDRAHRLYSVPSRFGVRTAGKIALLTHLVAIFFFCIAILLLPTGWWGYVGWWLFAVILGGQHLVLYFSHYEFSPRFMFVNGCNSLLLGTLLSIGLLL